MSDISQFSLQLNTKLLAQSYAKGEWRNINKIIANWLSGCTSLNSIDKFSQKQIYVLDKSIEDLIYFLTRDDSNFTQKEYYNLLGYNPLLSNLLAISSFGSSDDFVKSALNRARLSPVTPIFLSTRNTLEYDRARIFDINPKIGSEWYGHYFSAARGFVSKTVFNNLRNHLVFWDDRMIWTPLISNGYMRCTYIDPVNDRKFRVNFNQLTKRALSNIKIDNQPSSNHIAVFTGRWSPVNPTYKNRFRLFENLSKKYDLSLVHLGPARDDLETSIFKNVYHVEYQNNQFNGDILFKNNFGMVFYPDIGMNLESRLLSNLRIAPIQITTNSHPVSTFESEIDFFITGKESEEEPELAQRHYSERLILIPGIGTSPNYPSGKRFKQKDKKNQDTIYIACPWGSLKFNNPMIETLLKIKKSSKRNIVFKFFVTLDTQLCSVALFRKDVEHILGADGCEIYMNQKYEDYMSGLSGCSLALDPYPFGGNTSILDCMCLGIPIVSRKGWQFYNLAGPYILKKFKVPELGVDSESAYIDMTLRLIEDKDYLEGLCSKINAVDLDVVIENLTDSSKFEEAIDFLLSNQGIEKDVRPLEFY